KQVSFFLTEQWELAGQFLDWAVSLTNLCRTEGRDLGGPSCATGCCRKAKLCQDLGQGLNAIVQRCICGDFFVEPRLDITEILLREAAKCFLAAQFGKC